MVLNRKPGRKGRWTPPRAAPRNAAAAELRLPQATPLNARAADFVPGQGSHWPQHGPQLQPRDTQLTPNSTPREVVPAQDLKRPARDGSSYTFVEFVHFFGEQRGKEEWDLVGMALRYRTDSMLKVYRALVNSTRAPAKAKWKFSTVPVSLVEQCGNLISIGTALQADDLYSVDFLLALGWTTTPKQDDEIQMKRQRFSALVPSVYALHERYDAVASQRKLKCHPPAEFVDLITLLRGYVDYVYIRSSRAVASPEVASFIENEAFDINGSRRNLQRAQALVRQDPMQSELIDLRDTAWVDHSESLRSGCKSLLQRMALISGELEEHAFETERSDEHLEPFIDAVRSNLTALQISIDEAGATQGLRKHASDILVMIQSDWESMPTCQRIWEDLGYQSVQQFLEWEQCCKGQHLVANTEDATKVVRDALMHTAFVLERSKDETRHLGQCLFALESAVQEEEAFWASNPATTFSCGADLLAAGLAKLVSARSLEKQLSNMYKSLKGYEAELSDAELAMSPKHNRDPHVENFEAAALKRMEMDERYEDTLRVLTRARKRGQDNMEMHIAVSDSIDALRVADAELQDATSKIAGISFLFPEVIVHFKQGLPLDLMSLWVPDRTLAVFSEQELLSTASRNRVYKAEMCGRVFAIKEFCVTPASLKTCYREAAFLQRLRHPHVVELCAIFEDPHTSSLYLQFPYYKHGQLDAWVEKEHPDALSVRRCFWQIGLALQHLHACGVVHSDVKPANILIDHRGCARLADFDVSVDMNARTSVARATQIGFSLGYAAPELATRGATAASDMFAFGETIRTVAELTSARDKLVAQLKADDPELRPTAVEVLQHDFFSMVMVWHHDSIRQCCVMAGNLCEFGQADCRLSQGLECSGTVPHFVCSDCLNSHVEAMVGRQGSQQHLQEGRVHCPMYPSECQSCAFDDSQLSSRIKPGTFEKYIGARVALVEQRKAQELELEMQDRLAAELKQLAELDEQRRKVLQARHHIVEEILTLKCPRCGQAFADFDGCFALKCSRCPCNFCAWCGADGGHDAHEHVRRCQHKPRRADTFFGTAQQFNDACHKRRQRLLQSYFRSLDSQTRNMIRAELQHELAGLI